jgi:hypothetical protein
VTAAGTAARNAPGTAPGITLAAGGAVALLLAAGATGWLAPGAPQIATLAVVRHGGAAGGDAQPLARPGAGLAADVDGLETDLAVPPPPRPAAAYVAPRRPAGLTPAPVMHDVGPVFRSRTSAIVRLPNGRLAVLLAAGAGDGRSRLLHVGESYDDRWRLTGLTMNEAILTDGKSTERVPLFGEAVGAAVPGGDPQ